jgi:pimeloyl-ACP methyl ester carboxylesterase
MDSPSHEKTSPGPGLHLLGHSLGAAAALQFAERRPVERVILLAPFTTMRAMAELVVGRWLAGLLRHNFDNPACLRELQKRSPKPRVIIFHGREDTVVPVWMGRTLAAGAPEMVTLKEVAGAGHNDLLALCGHELGTAMKR